MQCDKVKAELLAYLSGELPADELAAIETHLSQCQSCSEEASAMDDLGRRLSDGLKLWVDQGVCPPEVMGQIEQSLRRERKRSPWWARPGYLATAAVAAVFLVALMGVRLELSPAQLASLPLVGTLAAQFLSDDAELAEDLGAQAMTINQSAEENGRKLVVSRMLSTKEATRIQYSLQGGADAAQPALTGPGGPIPLQRLATRQSGGQLVVTAEFDPVPSGQQIILTDQGLSVTFTAR